MTGKEIRRARMALGMSARRFADLVRVADGRTVRRWESGESLVPGPVSVLVELILSEPAIRKRFGIGTLAADVLERGQHGDRSQISRSSDGRGQEG